MFGKEQRKRARNRGCQLMIRGVDLRKVARPSLVRLAKQSSVSSQRKPFERGDDILSGARLIHEELYVPAILNLSVIEKCQSGCALELGHSVVRPPHRQ